MAKYYAEIVDGIVNQVLVIEDSWTEQEAITWLKTNVSDTSWIETKMDGSIRGKYAGITDEFHAEDDFFVGKKPYKSWVLNKKDKKYDAPKVKPKDSKKYEWDEKTVDWKEDLTPSPTTIEEINND